MTYNWSNNWMKLSKKEATRQYGSYVNYCSTWSSFWLAAGNEQHEKGNKKEAEKLYKKSQFWLDKVNKELKNN